MVGIQVKKRKRKYKRKTKKKLSAEKIQNIINIYLNNRALRKRKRKLAQKKRNPTNRIGGAYPLQNKAIDAISYSNQFRHTNDTRIMAIERGLNGLTGNMSQLTSKVRELRTPPLIQQQAAYSPPSNNYIENNNPNYPSSVVGSELNMSDAETISGADLSSPLATIQEGSPLSDPAPKQLFSQESKLEAPTDKELKAITFATSDAKNAELLVSYANSLDIHSLNNFVNSEGLVRTGMTGAFKDAIKKARDEKKERGGGR